MYCPYSHRKALWKPRRSSPHPQGWYYHLCGQICLFADILRYSCLVKILHQGTTAVPLSFRHQWEHKLRIISQATNYRESHNHTLSERLAHLSAHNTCYRHHERYYCLIIQTSSTFLLSLVLPFLAWSAQIVLEPYLPRLFAAQVFLGWLLEVLIF